MVTTRVQKSSWTDDDDRPREQYSTTIPKRLAEALDLEPGQEIEWKIHSGSALRVEADQ